jgi:hypothetical protein
MDKSIERLRLEPALSWKVAVNLLWMDEDSPDVRRARNAVREACLVQDLIATCDRQHGAYKKMGWGALGSLHPG